MSNSMGRISIIVDGGTSPRDIASTIIDLTDEGTRWRVMREGAILRRRNFHLLCQRMSDDSANRHPRGRWLLQGGALALAALAGCFSR
jgi:hypothetical protein